MKRPVISASTRSNSARLSRGYTLIEILVAITLTLMMMGAVVTIFAQIGSSVNESRATLEICDRLRSTAVRLRLDLEGLTVTMLPPRRTEANEGYFELIEGPVGPVTAPESFAQNTVDDPASPLPDTTVGDFDDILMFTTHAMGRPFVGRCGLDANGKKRALESDVAEIVWFVRGRTLYRRVLLVAPGALISNNAGPFYENYDISVRSQGGILVANTLGDLTKRECRFAHDPTEFPFIADWGLWGLPTLWDCTLPGWNTGVQVPVFKPFAPVDFWSEPPTSTIFGSVAPTSRMSEDVILTNVIGFDVKVWDPGAPVMRRPDGGVLLPGEPGYVPNADTAVSFGAYVDLGYFPAYQGSAANLLLPRPRFQHPGYKNTAGVGLTQTYCTWSFHYEHDGVDQDGDGLIDEGTDGFDNDTSADSLGYGVVDDPLERETIAPYPVPLRGIQIKIRVFEPDSRQIREVTVVQDFLPK